MLTRRPTVARIAALGAIVALRRPVVALVVNGNGGYGYDLLFQNGGQLVSGNQVLIGGEPVGSVDTHQADPRQPRQRPRHRRPAAPRRLDGGDPRHLALRRRQPLRLDLPRAQQQPGDAERRHAWASPRPPPRSTSTSSSTPSRPGTARALSEFIQGNAAIYAGRGPEANQTYKYFGPALNRTSAFFGELTADQRLLRRFVVGSADLFTTLSSAARRALLLGGQRQHGLRLDRRPERRRSTRRCASCRRPSARAAPPSSTSAPPSTTSTRWSTPRRPPPATSPPSSPT